MRDPSTYRFARRKMARDLMRELRAKGKPLDWRKAWASVQAAHQLARSNKQGQKP